MHQIPHILHCRAYLSECGKEGAFGVEHYFLAVFPFPYFPGACQLWGIGADGWVVRFCQRGVSVPLAVWGLMAGLPGFASHGSSLHLGAGCQ